MVATVEENGEGSTEKYTGLGGDVVVYVIRIWPA